MLRYERSEAGRQHADPSFSPDRSGVQRMRQARVGVAYCRRSRRAILSCIEIFYKDWGKGPPVVVSHGWPLDADAWDDQMMFLGQRGYRIIAHDRRKRT
jgi:hypothetical protein